MRTGFKDCLWRTIEAGDFRNFKLLDPQRFLTRSGTLYELPLGASSDLGSIPSAFWGPPLFLTPFGAWAHSYFLHDAAFRDSLLVVTGYDDATTGAEIKVPAHLTFEQANDLLEEAMFSQTPDPSDFERAQIEAVLHGVRLGGWKAFRDNRQA